MTSASLLLFALFAVGWSLDAPEKPVTLDLNNLPKSRPIDGDKTRLIKVDYKFETESVIYDELTNKVDAPSTIVRGNFTFQTLHYDLNGEVLSKFQLTVCHTDNCGQIPTVYVRYVQGGNNILGVYVDLDEIPGYEPEWNFIFSIINIIYTPAENGNGDEQYVSTVYGNCQVKFGRPEDKKFRRIIDGCDIVAPINQSRYAGIQVVSYHQEALYTQNVKVDADIVIVDAVEMLDLRSPFDPKWGVTAESRTRVEITNRTRLWVDRPCINDMMVDECARTAFKATSLGTKQYEKIPFGRKIESSKVVSAVAEYRDHLFEMGDSHTCELHSKMFANIVKEARTATDADWKVIVENPQNEPVLPAIANALGALGNAESLKTFREVVLPQSPELRADYLFGAANSLSTNEKWHKQIMYWLSESREDSEAFWAIANAAASILMRRCEKSSSSWNACNKDKEKIVLKLINDISQCKTEDCHRRALEVLYNLPIKASYDYAKTFICSSDHSSTTQTAALKIILQAAKTNYEPKLLNNLVKVFRNVCPHEATTTESQIAANIIIKSTPDQQSAASMLLRSEELYPKDHEKWSHFYSALTAETNKDELTGEFWSRLRNFRIFRPNWAQRSLKADSTVHWEELTDVHGFKIQQRTETEFQKGAFKRSDVDISLRKAKNQYNVFGLEVGTAGMNSLIGDSGDSGQSSSNVEPEASVRLSLFGHAMPIVPIFKGTSDMMSAVWNADGQTIKAFEGSVMIGESSTKIPLLSGASLEMNSIGAASVKILGSCEVSLWNRDSRTNLLVNISTSMGVEMTLCHHGSGVQRVSSDLSLVTSIGTHVDAIFNEQPFKFCLAVDHGDLNISGSITTEDLLTSKQNTNTRKTVHQSKTLLLNSKTTEKCNGFANYLKTL